MDNLFKSAVECYQNKQFEKAENICLKILELDPNNFDATNLDLLHQNYLDPILRFLDKYFPLFQIAYFGNTQLHF